MDASELKAGASSAAEEIKKLNEAMKEASSQGDWGQVATLSKAMDNLQSYRQGVAREANQAAREQQQSGGGMGGLVSAANTGSSMVQTMARGDPSGAVLSGLKGGGSLLSKAGGALSGTLGSVLGVIGGTALVGAAIGAGMNALSEQYEQVMPDMDKLNSIWGDNVAQNSYKKNSDQGLQFYSRAVDYAAGTGMETTEFMQHAAGMAKYGLGSEKSMQLARDQANWANFTGGSLDLFQQISGLSERYGRNGENALQKAYAGAQLTNLTKGQTDEFLSSMLRVMQEGIQKGFTRSAEEISANANMLYKLSGNSAMWQGENGMNRLSGMNNAIANATSLQTTNDVIMYSVANKLDAGKYLGNTATGGFTDTMRILERGVSADMLKGIFSEVGKLDSSPDEIISRFKNMFNTTYTEAADIYTMYKNSDNYTESDWKKFADQVTNMNVDHKAESDRTKLQDNVNTMKEAVVKIGSKMADLKVGALSSISTGVDKLVNHFLKDENNKMAQSSIKGLFGDRVLYEERKAAANAEAKIKANLESKDPEVRLATHEALANLNAMSPETRDILDRTNLPNKIDWSNLDEVNKLAKVDFSPDENGNYSRLAGDLYTNVYSKFNKTSQDELKDLFSTYQAAKKETRKEEAGFVSQEEFIKFFNALQKVLDSANKSANDNPQSSANTFNITAIMP
jgi:hypothetical protein